LTIIVGNEFNAYILSLFQAFTRLSLNLLLTLLNNFALRYSMKDLINMSVFNECA